MGNTGLIAGTLFLAATACFAQLDRAAMVEAYKQFDQAKNDGQGFSAEADSGALGWGEAGYLRAYSDLWQATGDAYWLGKIEDHFKRIIANASDPDGDGFLGWQTATYSSAVYWCQPLHNRGTALVEPGFYSEARAKAIAEVTGHTYVVSFLDPPTSFSVVDQTTRQVVAPEVAYKDGDTITAIPGCRVKVSGVACVGDRFMVRTLRPEPTEFTVHEGMIAYPVAVFIEAVAKAPALRERFGASADSFLQFISRHLLHKHERDWLETGDGGGGYRFADLITDRFPNRLMPHNQYLALARAFLVLKDVPGADPLLGKRAEQMARLFRSSLIAQDQAWVWHYWDWVEAGEKGASGFEDTSHGHIDIGFAVEAARRGVVFTADDMKRFTRTVLDLMWNGSESKPGLGPNCATRGDQHSFLMSDWLDLCQWEPRIYELALVNHRAAAKPAPASFPALLAAEKLCAK